MTRDFSFVLATAGIWYNLWNDLIAKDPGFDSTMSNQPYVPSSVSELTYQNQTPGATIQISGVNKESGFQLTGGSWDVKRSSGNDIDLRSKNVQTDTGGTVFNVSFVAH